MFVRVLAIALALWLGGCGVVREELNNRGGYVDYLADKYWWKTDSKKMRALRAYALHTAIARIAMISPKGANERNQLAYQIGTAGKYAQQMVKCAYDTVGEPCFYFDSIMVDYVGALYDAAITALPLDDAKKLVNSITGGVIGPAAAVDILHALIQLGADAVRYGTVTGALYRDSLELEVQVWINSPNEPGSMVSRGDVAALKAIYDTGRDNIPAWKAEIERLLNAGLEPTPNRRYLAKLFGLLSYACNQITPDPTFRSQCIVNPGTVDVVVFRDDGTGTGTNTRRRSGGSDADPAEQPKPKPASTNPELDKKRADLVDLRKQIRTNEDRLKTANEVLKRFPEGSAARVDMQRQIDDLNKQKEDLAQKLKVLQSEIDALQKKTS